MVVYPGLDRGLAHVEAVLPGLNHDSVIPTFELPLRGTLFAVGTRPSPFRGHLVATQGENVDAVRSRIVSLPTEPLSFDCALVGAATGSGSVLTLRPLDLSSREACRLSDRARLHPMVLTSLLGDPDREMFKRTLTETLSRWLDGAAVDVNLTEWLDDCPQPWVLNVEGVDA
jgi:hypothetical protein